MATWKGGKDSLPPVWVDKIELVEEETKKIQILMRELHTLHNKRLTVSFNTNEDDQERDINMKTLEITEVFRRAEGCLKKFGNQGDERNISASERTVRRNIQSQHARAMQELSLKFRASQKQYMQRVQAQKNGSGNDGFDYLDAPDPTGRDRSDLDVDLGFTTAQMVVVEEAEDLVNQRDGEIQQIAKSACIFYLLLDPSLPPTLSLSFFLFRSFSLSLFLSLSLSFPFVLSLSLSFFLHRVLAWHAGHGMSLTIFLPPLPPNLPTYLHPCHRYRRARPDLQGAGRAGDRPGHYLGPH
jgi:hypothetical protein